MQALSTLPLLGDAAAAGLPSWLWIVGALLLVGVGVALGRRSSRPPADRAAEARPAVAPLPAPSATPAREDRPESERPVAINETMSLREVREAKRVRLTGDFKASDEATTEMERRKGRTGAVEAVELSLQPEAEPAPTAAPTAAPTPAPAPGRTMGSGLEKTRGGFVAKLGALFSAKPKLDAAAIDQVEEVLFTSDIGVKASERLLGALNRRVAAGEATADEVWPILREEARSILAAHHRPLVVGEGVTVILVVGVNGAGKTTTIGKLAARFKAAGRRPMVIAGDTFRAGAVGQLEEWAKRVGCPIHQGAEGADPASVVFSGLKAATEAGADLILVDTAGRLQTKAPLMDELRKIAKVCDRAIAGAPHETVLVLDANTGQNAIQQAKLFSEVALLTGLVLTKLDGTAKGGAVLGIADEVKVPIYFIGIGEAVEDLRAFEVSEFVEALF